VPSSPETRPRPSACLNCGSTRVDAFCAQCGQRNMDMRIPARDLALDAVEDGLSLDSRMARTVVPFLLRPGFLTVEWTSGRRARFSSPLRLYLLTSFVFFVASGVAGDGSPIRFDVTPDASELQQAQEDLDAAGVPVDVVAAAKEARDAPHVPAGTEEQHRRLRAQGWLGRTIDDRWQALARMPRQEFLSRVNTAFREWVPRVMFFLVPAAVAILALLWRRRWLSEHVVLSLHLHAFAFTVFTVLLALRLLPWEGPRAVLGPVLALSLPLYVVLAMRRVYGQTWRWTVPKAMAAGLLYLVALFIGLVGIAGLALYFA
jgi:hypothetical protein